MKKTALKSAVKIYTWDASRVLIFSWGSITVLMETSWFIDAIKYAIYLETSTSWNHGRFKSSGDLYVKLVPKTPEI